MKSMLHSVFQLKHIDFCHSSKSGVEIDATFIDRNYLMCVEYHFLQYLLKLSTIIHISQS